MTKVPPSLADPETLRHEAQGRHPTHADELLTPTTHEGGVVQQYRSLCATAECRANSAVLRYLQGRVDADKPLTELPFQHFYVGPKGFEPVLGLIQVSQTAERIDLRGNGLDNNCVMLLCQTLERHLGVRSILLGDNPITVDGGKYLVHLLERNHRITELELSGTNVYESMCKRMAMILQENIEAAQSGISLVPSRPSVMRGSSAGSSHSTAPLRESRADMTLLVKQVHDTPLSNAHRAKSSPMKRKGSPPNASSGSIMLEDGATTSAPKPRPPPPALVSREASRLTEKQRADLLAKYNERAQLYQQVVRSDASRAADRAREELMRIEQRGVVDAPPAARTADVVMQQPRPASGNIPTIVSPSRPVVSTNVKATPRKSLVESPKKSVTLVGGESSSPMDIGRSQSTARWSLSELPELSDDVEPLDAAMQNHGRRPTLRNPSDHAAADPTGVGVTLNENAIGFQMLPLTLTRDEQFRELFSKGCQQYNDKQLDAAYLTWNEAMDLAVTNKNREWMSVISNNLQRLSYEILVAEGVQYLDGQRLEEADKAFQLALDVANKAKNAAWEGEMHRARKNVQHAVFQRSHEAALRLFERAQNVKEQVVTSDDRFTIPGDASGSAALREYSGAFVSEWSRMLLVKEAMEMWADATMMARKISGSSGKVLNEVVTAAVDSVCAFLAQKQFAAEPHGNILSLQRTSAFSYVEALKLIELWTDVVSKTQTALANRTWDAVAASVLGNLFLASNQLPQALNQFEKLVDAGIDRQDNFLTGLGNTYLGILHWQRSNFSISEKCFVVALNEWKRLRVAHGRGGDDFTASTAHSDADVPTAASVELSVHGVESHHHAAPNSAIASTVSVEYLNVMLSKCFTYLIRIMFTTSRYRDALEMLERGHLHRYKDRLHEKMLHNFTAKPTIDHIMAVAASLDTPLVYYETSYRFDWSTSRDAYDVSQQLMVWVVVKGTEMKVVRVDVTNDFNVASVDVLVEQVRRTLCVLPIHDLGVQESILTSLPDQSWRDPLSKLYEILIHPIVDFIAAHDMHRNSRGGAFTVMPSSSLWLVPFNGLIMRDGKFLVEEYAVQLAFCGIQSAFCGLSARRVKDRGLRKRVAVVYPADSDHSDAQMNRIMADHRIPFPVDALRSFKEGERLVDTMSHRSGGQSRGVVPKAATTTTPRNNGTASQSTAATAMDGKHVTECEVVDDIQSLRDVITKARVLHFATATATTADNDDGSSGALLLPAGQDEMSLLRAAEVASYDIMAELVVMSQSHINADWVRTTKEPTLGLCRAFLSAGAASVIAALWCTPDMMPVELMDHFYSILSTGKEVHRAKAMALATRKLLTDDKYRINPRAWCGFFLLGVGLTPLQPAQRQ